MGIWRAPDRWIGGVASGIGVRLGIDALIVRGIFLVITLFGGLGLLVYGVAWALLPEASDSRIHLQEAIRGRFDAALAGAIIFTLIGLSRIGFWWGGWANLPIAFGLLALSGLIIVIVLAVRSGTKHTGSTPPGTPPPGHPGPQPAPTGPPPHPGWENPVPATSSDPAQPYGAAPEATSHEQSAEPGGPWHAGGDAWATSAMPPAAASMPPPADPPGPPAGPPPTTGGPAGPVTPPPPPPHPKRPGPGRGLIRATWGLALVAIAALALGADYYHWPINPWLLALGGALVIFGLGVCVAGFLGRRTGSLSFMGVLLAVVLLPWAFVANSVETTHHFWNPTHYGEMYWAPSGAAEAAEGFDDLAAGSVTVDLEGLEDVDVASPINIDVGAGEATVLVPEGMPVVINTHVQGQVSTAGLSDWTAGTGDRSIDLGNRSSIGWQIGTALEAQMRSPAATQTADPVEVNVDVGIGSIDIREVS